MAWREALCRRAYGRLKCLAYSALFVSLHLRDRWAAPPVKFTGGACLCSPCVSVRTAGRRRRTGASRRRLRPASAAWTPAWPDAVRATTGPARPRVLRSRRPTGRDPPVADDRCTRRVAHHTTMIDDQELDASPPTVHEPVRAVPLFARPHPSCGPAALTGRPTGQIGHQESGWARSRTVRTLSDHVLPRVQRRLPALRVRRVPTLLQRQHLADPEAHLSWLS